MHALELLSADHRRVERMLADLEGTTTRGVRTRTELFERLERELVAHETIEEEIFYPALRDHPKAAEIVLEAFIEHDVVDRLLGELRATPVEAHEWGPLLKGDGREPPPSHRGGGEGDVPTGPLRTIGRSSTSSGSGCPLAGRR